MLNAATPHALAVSVAVAAVAALGVLAAPQTARAASGIEHYFPYFSSYADPKITVRASDRSNIELLLHSENPHIPNGTGRDGTRRSYFLNTLTTSRDIAGLVIDFADPSSTTKINTVSLVYETTDGLAWDCYDPTAFNQPFVRLATPLAGPNVPSTTVQRTANCFTDFATQPVLATFDVGTSAPHRLKTLDGTELDVVDVVVKKNGTAWRTWQFAYNLGLVGLVSNNPAAPFGFQAVTVVPPPVEPLVVEFWNAQDFAGPGGHYFYTTDPEEMRALETGRFGAWARTGRTFNSGGYAPVCRFYGSVSPGPNSHFFTASATECEGLKAAQKPASSVPQWNFETLAFSVTPPRTGVDASATCINGTIPVRRAYNNAFTPSGRNPWDSNHRLALSQADIDAVVKLGWKDEGIVFCVPL